jgi:GNAT superfamily N-acetyltransferase
MTAENIILRAATKADCTALSVLMTELGYPTTPAEMITRFENIENHADYRTIVAIAGQKVIGMLGATKNFFYEKNGIYVRIVVLVTDSSYRKKGVGKLLVDDIQNWAKEIGAGSMLVNCGNREEREEAHQFYKNKGFTVKSSGYVKML